MRIPSSRVCFNEADGSLLSFPTTICLTCLRRFSERSLDFHIMSLTDLIAAEAVIPSLKANTKKQALLDLSNHAAQISDLDAREIFDTVLQRERLGSTGIGSGIAIPHAKLHKAKSIFGVFARLVRPIEFDAIDGMPVDLICLLITPESAGADHLKALARLARLLRNPATAEKLRAARDQSALYSVLTANETSRAA